MDYLEIIGSSYRNGVFATHYGLGCGSARKSFFGRFRFVGRPNVSTCFVASFTFTHGSSEATKPSELKFRHTTTSVFLNDLRSQVLRH